VTRKGLDGKKETKEPSDLEQESYRRAPTGEGGITEKKSVDKAKRIHGGPWTKKKLKNHEEQNKKDLCPTHPRPKEQKRWKLS